MDQEPKDLAPPDAHGPLPLVRYLVAAGVGARRASAALVMTDRVRVNGQPAGGLTQEILPTDRVTVDGREVHANAEAVYILLHKPASYLTTVQDTHGRPTVMDLVPPEYLVPGLVPVGRLDMESTGLLLLTNDGHLAHRLTHPSYGVEKEYHVTVDTPLAAAQVRQLLRGVYLEYGPARAAALWPLTVRSRRRVTNLTSRAGEDGVSRPSRPGVRPPPQKPTRYSVTLGEGQKREIRLMFRAVGHAVLGLKRVRMGTLRLSALEPGEVRSLTPIEVQRLKELVARPSLPPRQSAPRTQWSPSSRTGSGDRPPQLTARRPAARVAPPRRRRGV